jgi:hypothetical protein
MYFQFPVVQNKKVLPSKLLFFSVFLYEVSLEKAREGTGLNLVADISYACLIWVKFIRKKTQIVRRITCKCSLKQ